MHKNPGACACSLYVRKRAIHTGFNLRAGQRFIKEKKNILINICVSDLL